MLTLNDLPEWILKSKFVKILKEDNADEEPDINSIIELNPKFRECMFNLPDYISSTNVKKIIESMIYFEIEDEELNKDIFYALKEEFSLDEINDLHVNIKDLSFYPDLHFMKTNIFPFSEKSLLEGVKLNLKLYTNWVLSSNNDLYNTSGLSNAAAQSGNLSLLEKIYRFNRKLDKDTCSHAAYYNHLDCLIYAFEVGCNFDGSTLVISIRKNYLKIFKYVYENFDVDHLNSIKNEIFYDVCRNGNIEMLKIIFEQEDVVFEDDEDEDGEHFYENVGGILVSNGYINCIDFLHKKGFNKFSISFTKDIDTIKYLRSIGVGWEEETILDIINIPIKIKSDDGVLECIKFSLENGCLYENRFTSYLLASQYYKCLDFILQNNYHTNKETDYDICEESVFYDEYNCLDIAIKHNCPFNKNLINKSKSIMICKFLHEKGCEITDETVEIFKREKLLKCYEYSVENLKK
jgi:hypothetical protein